MICILMYAVKAVADTLLLISTPIGNMLGVLVTIGSLIGILLHIPKVVNAIWLR